MSLLATNLTKLRETAGKSVRDVHAELNRKGVDVAYSTVAGWFNGRREVRGMKNLIALCEVLQADLNSVGGDEIEIVEGETDVTAARELKSLTPVQKEAVIALIRSMKGGR